MRGTNYTGSENNGVPTMVHTGEMGGGSTNPHVLLLIFIILIVFLLFIHDKRDGRTSVEGGLGGSDWAKLLGLQSLTANAQENKTAQNQILANQNEIAMSQLQASKTDLAIENSLLKGQIYSDAKFNEVYKNQAITDQKVDFATFQAQNLFEKTRYDGLLETTGILSALSRKPNFAEPTALTCNPCSVNGFSDYSGVNSRTYGGC
jgi:hypothetical protein